MNKQIKEYEIDVAGNSYGQQLPANHRMLVMGSLVRVKDTDDGYDLILFVDTYTDSNHDTKVKNDLIPDDQVTIDLGATLPTSGTKTLAKNNFETWLDSNVGENDWTEII